MLQKTYFVQRRAGFLYPFFCLLLFTHGCVIEKRQSPASSSSIGPSPPLSASPHDNQAYFPIPKIPESRPLLISPPNAPEIQQGGCPPRKLVMAYYPDWVVNEFPPEKIDFGRFDWIDYAFAFPDSKFGLVFENAKQGPDLLRRLVTAAHSRGKKVKLSIGGWTGSKYFSTAVSTDANRQTLTNNILSAYTSYNLDGIDIDWEYPGRKGNTGNKISSKDSTNFLVFLNLLRMRLPPSARISAAVETVTFSGNDGKPMTDVSKFAAVLDWVTIMNYDVWGSSSKPGPNAPFRDGCGNSTQPTANAVSAYNTWTRANFPSCKLVLGLPSYGYLSQSLESRLRNRSTKHKSKTSKQAASKAVVLSSGENDSTGQIQFGDLVKQGALVRASGVAPAAFGAAGGFERHWDICSDTPFLRSSASRQVVSYDDVDSLKMKAKFAKDSKMLGVNIFDVHGDTEQWDLTAAIRSSLDL